jgi:hypothetical protein
MTKNAVINHTCHTPHQQVPGGVIAVQFGANQFAKEQQEENKKKKKVEANPLTATAKPKKWKNLFGRA